MIKNKYPYKLIIHFHPSEMMAKKFVMPLIRTERLNGYKSILIASSNNPYGVKFSLKLTNIILYPFMLIKILILLKKFSPQIIISHNTTSSLLPLLAGKIANVNRIIYFNHGIPYIGHKGIVRVTLKYLEKINLFLADQIVTVSQDMKDILKKNTFKNINLIFNGSACGIEFRKKKLVSESFKIKYKIKKTDFIYAYIGRPEARKGFNFIIKIWSKYFANKKNLLLLIIGGDTYVPKKLRSISNLKFLGFSNEIPKILSNIDCLIIPSKHEGLSYVALEALAYNCPIIASNIPGMRCLLNSKNSIVVDKFDAFDYFKAMNKMKSNLSKKIKTNILNNEILKKYDRNKFMKYYINFIKKNEIK